MIFAFAAVPLIVARKGLLHREIIEAIVDVNFTRLVVHREPSSLVNIDHSGLFDQLNISLRLTAPLGHDNELTVAECFTYGTYFLAFVFGSKITVVFMVTVAQFTLFTVREEQSRHRCRIIEDLKLVKGVVDAFRVILSKVGFEESFVFSVQHCFLAVVGIVSVDLACA